MRTAFLLVPVVLAACGRTEPVRFDPPPVPPVDAGLLPRDAGPPDAGPPDAGAPDAGRPDAGSDGGPGDAGAADAGRDAGFDAGPGLARSDVVYVHEDRQLFTWDPVSGALSQVPTFACGAATDMAIDRAGRAFVVAGTGLYRLDVQSGRCTFVALLPEGLVALTFLPAGALDPVEETLVGYGELAYWEFDPVDGTSVRLGSSALSGNVVPSGDLTPLADGRTYLSVRDRAWPSDRSDELVRIDPRSGAVVENLGVIGLPEVWGLATFDDELYGFNVDGQVARLRIVDGGVQSVLVPLAGPRRSFWGAAARPLAGSARDAGP
jgi:hypothetical protein